MHSKTYLEITFNPKESSEEEIKQKIRCQHGILKVRDMFKIEKPETKVK